MNKKKIIITGVLLSSAALILAACGTTAAAPHTGTASNSRSTSAKVISVRPPAVLEHATIQTISRSACGKFEKTGTTYQFGNTESGNCTTGVLDLTVQLPQPRFPGSPVTVALTDLGWTSSVTATVNGGRLVPLSPWMNETFSTEDPWMNETFSSSNQPPSFLTQTDSNVVTALAPTSQIPPMSEISVPGKTTGFEEMATWLWYPPTSAATLSITGMKPVTIPAAYLHAIAHLHSAPQIASSVTVGLSFSAAGTSESQASKVISSEGVTGTVTAADTGGAKVSPAPGLAHPESLAGTTYTWSDPKPGQSVAVADRVFHVPFTVNPVSFTGYIGLLTGLDLYWKDGPASLVITPQGQTTQRLTISAPSRVEVGKNVLVTVTLTQNGRPEPAAPISVTAPPAHTVVKTSSSGSAMAEFHAYAPGRTVVTARTSTGLLAITVVTVVRPFPWWILVLIIAAALVIITEIVRRYRKRRKSFAPTDPDGSLPGPEPTSTPGTEFAELDEVPDGE